jgi:hypothetical protein
MRHYAHPAIHIVTLHDCCKVADKKPWLCWITGAAVAIYRRVVLHIYTLCQCQSIFWLLLCLLVVFRAVYPKGVGAPGLARYLQEANREVEVWVQVRAQHSAQFLLGGPCLWSPALASYPARWKRPKPFQG